MLKRAVYGIIYQGYVYKPMRKKLMNYLDKLEKLCERATEGPWWSCGQTPMKSLNNKQIEESRSESKTLNGVDIIIQTSAYNVLGHNGEISKYLTLGESFSNSEFVAESRSAVPKLIKALRQAMITLEENSSNGVGIDDTIIKINQILEAIHA